MAAQMKLKGLSDVVWPEAYEAQIANLSGKVSYGSSGNFSGTDQTGSSLLDVAMSFIVDFVGGHESISRGQLSVVDSTGIDWSANFSGSLSGAFAEMQIHSGYLSTGAPVTNASIQGMFIGTNPDFLSGFFMKSGDSSVQGFSILTP